MLIHDALITRLRAARRLVIFTGAGVSQESGIPTFRDKQTGLWANFDAEDLATPAAFRSDPALVWGWYEWRRTLIRRAEPNAAHRAIAEMEKNVPQLTLVTQNVDDLHERAGSSRVLHLHGEIARARCESCGDVHLHSTQEPSAAEPGRLEPPRCARCGARVRPGVVWFGESLPAEPWREALEAARHADVFFCVGTSSVVQPAASLTDLAIRAGAATVQINPNLTGIDDRVSFLYRAAAGSVLPALVAQWSVSRSPARPGH
jgi:NAD-dependent deacetylase